MTERILIVSANPWSFCMAVERDLAELHRDAQVDVLNLYRLCSARSPHWRRRDRLIEALNRKIERFVVPPVSGRDITPEISLRPGKIPAIPATYEALRSYEEGEAKIGLATLSSVSSMTTIQYPNDLSEYGSTLASAWESAHISARIGRIVKDMGYQRVFIFNGRHCYSRPFCDLLERVAEVIRYEQGSAGNRYISAAGSIHDPGALAELIERHPVDAEAGEYFYRERLQKDVRSEVNLMTMYQRKGYLPELVEQEPIFSFFSSSSDEMFAVTDSALYGSFRSQQEIAVVLAEACAERGLRLVLRLHPHLLFKHEAWRREWDFPALSRLGVVILEPEDSCDSYALVRASTGVITTGSTIGLEASYLGVPNAVVGHWVGGCLGASVVANTAEELRDFVALPRLPEKGREAAIRYGSFYKTGGRLLPELDVGIHPNFARIDGRIVDPVRFAVEKVRRLFNPRRPSGDALDIKSGLQGGRVLLPPGTNYASLLKRRN